MRRYVLAATLLLVSACGGEEEEGDPPADDRGPGGFQADFRTSSDFFTLMAEPETGSSPHVTVRIWYSSNLRSLVTSSSFTAPEGSVAIKEFDMESDGSPDGLAVMVKKDGAYDPDNGNWYYEVRSLTGEVMADPPAGRTEMCITCHVAASGTDYLAGTRL